MNRRGRRRSEKPPTHGEAVKAAAQKIERAADETYSKQPRFEGDAADRAYGAVYYFLKLATREMEQMAYRADSARRDQWLRQTWTREPYWASVVKTCALLDANRAWTMTGGRNQVYRYTRLLHGAENGAGWREFCQKSALAFRTADMCSVTELGRDGEDGPLRGLYFVDPARCRLTGKPDEPLEYTPAGGTKQGWKPYDFFRAVSCGSTDEAMRGLGWCATSMAFELLALLYGVLLHDQEAVGARMPRGLLLLKGISEDQWQQALKSRKHALNAEDQQRFGGTMVLATSGDVPPEANLVALSQLPAEFDRATFLEQTWYGYAAIVGYDASEFFPVQTGSIGRGNEPDIQHRKATKKGGAEFTLAWQERFQQELPDTVLFEFEERDDEARLGEAELAAAWAEAVSLIRYPTGSGMDPEQITREQALSLLIEQLPGLIPPEWTEEMEEEEQATDAGEARARHLRERVLSRPEVVRACLEYPRDPVVCYRWTPHRCTETVLWERGDEALRRRSWAVPRLSRVEGGESKVLFEGDDVRITEADVDRALAEAARRVSGAGTRDDPGLAALLKAEPEEEGMTVRESLTRSARAAARGVLAGLRSAGKSARDVTEAVREGVRGE